MSEQIVAVVGRGTVDEATPLASADDLGLTRGDGCFEATLAWRTAQGLRVLDLDAHLDRLDRSASALAIDGAPDRAAWRAAIDAALADWSGEQATLKLVLTRGPETIAGTPLAYCTVTEVSAPMRAKRRGNRVCTLARGYASDAFADAPWLLGGVKTLSYAVNQAAKREAARRGDDDVLFVSSDGFALEGPTSTLVWLDGDELVTTPQGSTGILASVTLTKVFAEPPAGLTPVFRLATPDEVAEGQGAWLLSSVVGVAPTTHLDGRELARNPEVDAALRRATGFAGA